MRIRECLLVADMSDGVQLEFYEFDDKESGTISGIYCQDCAARYKKDLGAWIERWCDHVKATPLLRSGDICSLVNSMVVKM